MYGYWSLLWIIFGYSLLLDFGFGMSVQKASALFTLDKNLDEYNTQINTVFFSYILIAAIIIFLTIVCYFNIDFIISHKYDDLQKGLMQQYFLEFGIYCAVIFPTGIFRESLVGLNRMDFRNYIVLVYELLNLGLIYSVAAHNLPFEYLIRGSLGLCLLTNLVCFFMTKKISGFSMGIQYFKKSKIKKIIQFSLSAYIIMCSNLIILKTDQLLISLFGTLSLVGLYQIASRIPFLFKMLAEQMQECLIPLTVRLFSSKQTKKLTKLFIISTRVNIYISTCGFYIFYISCEKFLFLWLGINTLEIIQTGKLLIVSTFIIVLGKSVAANMLLMANEHKYLSRISIYEASGNLLLTLILVPKMGIIGAAIGTVIPQFISSFFFILPKAFFVFETRFKEDILRPILTTFFSSVIPICILLNLLTSKHASSLVGLMFIMILCGICYLFFGYLFCLSKVEKNSLHDLVNSKIHVLKK